MKIDGALELGSVDASNVAPGFDLIARRKTLYDWVRSMRGGVLTGVFTIESHISAAILHFFLGDRITIPEVLNAFEETILTKMQFDRRISTISQIAPNFLPDNEVKDLRSHLNELKTIRNAMAHNPFWFEPLLDDQGRLVDITPRINIGKGSQAITTDFVKELNQKIAGLIGRSHDLRKKVIFHEAARPE